MADTSTRGSTAPSRPLHVAMVAPPYFSIPPEGYGGVESVVAGLVDGLVDRGHRVTLLAAGEHGTRAQRFIRDVGRAPHGPARRGPSRGRERRPGGGPDRRRHRLRRRARPHPGRTAAGPRPTGADPGDRARRRERAGRVYRPLGADLAGRHLREPTPLAPDLNWVGPSTTRSTSSFPFRDRKDDYVLFLGRFHPTKDRTWPSTRPGGRAPDRRRRQVRRAGGAGVLRGRDRAADGAGRRLVGDADGAEKRLLLAGARCLVFPILWDEPFGMVMVEAMACGTPVVALAQRRCPEVVVDGSPASSSSTSPSSPPRSTGPGLDPADCRRHVENASASRPWPPATRRPTARWP